MKSNLIFEAHASIHTPSFIIGQTYICKGRLVENILIKNCWSRIVSPDGTQVHLKTRDFQKRRVTGAESSMPKRRNSDERARVIKDRERRELNRQREIKKREDDLNATSLPNNSPATPDSN